MWLHLETIKRHFWIELVEKAWSARSIVWLSGVRRIGKTCLSQSLENIEYFDCELPRIRRMMEDPQGFLDTLRKRRVVLDEIHRLSHPSELLKIAADHYPDIRILATGSSTLGASHKFRDTLTGRKRDIWLTPICLEDLSAFKRGNIKDRLQKGGLPPFFISEKVLESDFQEWVDSFWAKDIQELFRLERRHSFQKFVELILIQSGGIFEATKMAGPCEVSRTTISNYLKVLEETFVAHVIRPFSTNPSMEIVSAPKVYGFDTGFVCYYRRLSELRSEDLGVLWEHFVLDEIMAEMQTRKINYWRDKRDHEVDFILVQQGTPPLALECKWSADHYDPAGLMAFRRRYKEGNNYVICADVEKSYSRKFNGVTVAFVSLKTLIKEIKGSQNRHP